MEKRRLKAGEMLYVQGTPASHMYRVETGIIAGYIALKTPVLIGFFKYGDILGIEASQNLSYSFTTQCVETAEVEVHHSDQASQWLSEENYTDMLSFISQQMDGWLNQKGITTPDDVITMLQQIKEIDETVCRHFFDPGLLRKALEKMVSEKKIKKLDRTTYRCIEKED